MDSPHLAGMGSTPTRNPLASHRIAMRGGTGGVSEDQTIELAPGDLAARLSAQHPGLTVTSSPGDVLGPTLLGWTVPRWLSYAGAGLTLAVLLLLVLGPAPLRATRWAWFWLMAVPVSLLQGRRCRLTRRPCNRLCPNRAAALVGGRPCSSPS